MRRLITLCARSLLAMRYVFRLRCSLHLAWIKAAR